MGRYEDIFRPLQNGSDVRGSAIATDKEPLTLTPEYALCIAAAFKTWLAERCGKEVSALRIGIGHDSRLTAEALKGGIIKGFAGARVYDCHLVSTPAMFLSTVLSASDFDGSVMITASHLPFNRNGMKFFTKDGGLEHDDITEILKMAADICPESLADGTDVSDFDLVTAYSEHLKEIICKEVQAEDYAHPLTGLHIVVDAGNGAAGFFADRILKELGADTEGSVFLDPDGHFPNHVPNPENATAMEAIRQATVSSGADLGVIFDCDGDRGAAVFASGEEINRNALIALMAAILKKDHPGATVVTDSVTSDELTVFLEDELGMKHLRFKRGYKNVINKGIELNKAGIDCPLAIETSGHGALSENYFSDDGAYLCVKIICEMARLRREGRKIDELIAALGSPAEAKEVRYHISGSDFAAYGQDVLRKFEVFAEADPRFHLVKPNAEGVRVSFDDKEVKGWMLLRMSLHDPVMPVNMESRDAGGVKIIEERTAPFFAAQARLEK